MAQETWHYSENQFDNATKKSKKRMNILSTDHWSKLKAEQNDPDIAPLEARYAPVHQAYTDKYGKWLMQKGVYKGATQGMQELQDELSASVIAAWDNQIKVAVGEDTKDYTALLPNGRGHFQTGGRDARIMVVKGLGEGLAKYPALATLKAQVDAFYNQMKQLRDIQQQNEDLIEKTSDELELLRIECALFMYANLGRLMDKFFRTPEMVDRFYELQLLRQTGADEEEPEPIVPGETIVIATKQNPPAPFSIEIMGTAGEEVNYDMGDGTTGTLIMDGTFVPLAHTYAAIGNYTISVTGAKDAFIEMQALNGQHSSINLPEGINLRGLTLNDNQFSSLYIPTTYTDLIALSAANNDIDQQSINLILTTINDFGTSNGVIYLNGGNNQSPSGQGIAAMNALIARGWTVVTN